MLSEESNNTRVLIIVGEAAEVRLHIEENFDYICLFNNR